MVHRHRNTGFNITSVDISIAISKLKKGKSADPDMLCAEHFILGKDILSKFLTPYFNNMSENEIPSALKEEKKCAIPKKGKNDLIMDDHRCIGIAKFLIKIYELIVKQKEGPIPQSLQQVGFTSGLCPQLAALTLTEVICNARNTHQNLYAATLDASKAFDKVHRSIMLLELHLTGCSSEMWCSIDNLYSNTTAHVVWQGKKSKIIDVELGTGQGRALAGDMYKVQIDPMLRSLENSYHGAHIGCTNVGNPTCADDVNLLAYESLNLQLLLNDCYLSNGRSRAKINTLKTEIATSKEKENEEPFFYGNEQLPKTKILTHLGLKRTLQKPSADIHDKMSTARRSMYSQLPAGIHGTNGVSPTVSRKVIQMYVVPVLLSGLEAVIVDSCQRKQLDVFLNQCVRNLQALRKGTANCALYMLFGLLPVEAELDKRVLQLLGIVTRLDDQAPLKIIAKRQIASPKISKGWFTMAMLIAQKYGVEALVVQALYSFMKIQEWKKSIGDAVFYFWQQSIKEQARQSSSLKYMDIKKVTILRASHIWPIKGDSRLRTAASYRSKMVTGSYILQSNRARFNQTETDPSCPMCGYKCEDMPHFITECSALEEVRQSILPKLLLLYEKHEISKDRDQLTIKILNCGPDIETSTCTRKKDHKKYKILLKNPCPCVKKANLASLLCLKLHNKRNDLLYEKNDMIKTTKKGNPKNKILKDKDKVRNKDTDACIHCCKKVTESAKALCCDKCERWQHIKCQNILTEKSYQSLVKYSISIPWECSKCLKRPKNCLKLPNYTVIYNHKNVLITHTHTPTPQPNPIIPFMYHVNTSRVYLYFCI